MCVCVRVCAYVCVYVSERIEVGRLWFDKQAWLPHMGCVWCPLICLYEVRSSIKRMWDIVCSVFSCDSSLSFLSILFLLSTTTTSSSSSSSSSSLFLLLLLLLPLLPSSLFLLFLLLLPSLFLLLLLLFPLPPSSLFLLFLLLLLLLLLFPLVPPSFSSSFSFSSFSSYTSPSSPSSQLKLTVTQPLLQELLEKCAQCSDVAMETSALVAAPSPSLITPHPLTPHEATSLQLCLSCFTPATASCFHGNPGALPSSQLLHKALRTPTPLPSPFPSPQEMAIERVRDK